MRKDCRICWNTRYWREPTGEAATMETGKTYAREHGILFPREHKVYRINRYQPIDWDDNFPAEGIVTGRGLPLSAAGSPRSEEQRQRAAVDGTTYSPRHVILQNALYRHLCEVHGRDAVQYEVSFIDLTVKANGGAMYFEIKIAPTAKRCIREALGQLLEYGIYPD